MPYESIFTEVTVTGITVYGLALLFIKALFILLLAQAFSDSFEFSPASMRHTVWLIALVSLAVLPILTFILPAWGLFSIDVIAPAKATYDGIVQNDLAIGAAPFTLSFLDWLVIIYLIVVAGRLAYLSVEIVKVGWVTAKSRNADKCWYDDASVYLNSPYGDRLKIKISPILNGPVTWGKLYPVILLPEGCEHWTRLEKEMVLRHELGHIQRADWLAQLLGQLVALLYWPVPGISKALGLLSLEAERACDDIVLGDGVTPADYAALLLRQAKVNTLPATVALGKSSELVQRVRHIVSSYVDRAGERRARVLLAVGAGLFLLPFASIQAIGNLPQGGPFAGMSLTPIVLSTKESPQAQIIQTQKNIDRPSRPINVVSPPPNSSLNYGLSIKVEDSSASMSSIENTSSHTLELSHLSASSAQVRIKQQPEYPLYAQRRGIEGRVVVEFDIDSEGVVINPRIADSESTSVFNRSVLKAISGYRYEPYRLGGEAIGLQGLKEEFRFELIQDQPTKRVSTGDSRAGQNTQLDSS